MRGEGELQPFKAMKKLALLFHTRTQPLINTGASARCNDVLWRAKLFQQFTRRRWKPLKRLDPREIWSHRAKASVLMKSCRVARKISSLGLFRLVWRSITFFRFFGVPVQFHTSWFVFPVSLLLMSGFLLGRWLGFFLSLCFLALMVGSILCHEFAHVLTARAYGCGTRRVLMIPFACIAELEAMPLGFPEIWMAAAGPFASSLISALAWLAAYFTEGTSSLTLWRAHQMFAGISLLNFFLACFNLIPCFLMDGGRIFRSTLAVLIERLFPRRAASAQILATRIAVRYVARTIVAGVIVLTIFYTHLWHHILIFGILALAGEAEYFLLREEAGTMSKPHELRFLPLTEQSSPIRHRRHSKRIRRPVQCSLKLRLDPLHLRPCGSAPLRFNLAPP